MRRVGTLIAAGVLAGALLAPGAGYASHGVLTTLPGALFLPSGTNYAPPDDIDGADFVFTATAGQEVTYLNLDPTESVVGPHTVTHAGSPQAFDTGLVSFGAMGAFNAPSSAGDYPFFCAVHPNMTGILRVT